MDVRLSILRPNTRENSNGPTMKGNIIQRNFPMTLVLFVQRHSFHLSNESHINILFTLGIKKLFSLHRQISMSTGGQTPTNQRPRCTGFDRQPAILDNNPMLPVRSATVNVSDSIRPKFFSTQLYSQCDAVYDGRQMCQSTF